MVGQDFLKRFFGLRALSLSLPRICTTAASRRRSTFSWEERKVFTVLQQFRGTDRKGATGTGGDGLGFEKLFSEISEIYAHLELTWRDYRPAERAKSATTKAAGAETYRREGIGLGSLCTGQTSGWGSCRGSRDITTTIPSAPGRTPSIQQSSSW